MSTRPENRKPDTPQPEEMLAGTAQRRPGGYQRQTIVEAAIKSFVRSIAGSIGRAIMRAIVGRR